MKKVKILKPEEMTYKEVVLFQQYFGQIIYDFDQKTFAQLKEEIKTELNANRPINASFLLENFNQKLVVQEVGSDAWMICYALIIQKGETIIEQEKLIEFYNKNLIKTKTDALKSAVVDFSKAFPMLHLEYQKRAERLTAITELIF